MQINQNPLLLHPTSNDLQDLDLKFMGIHQEYKHQLFHFIDYISDMGSYVLITWAG